MIALGRIAPVVLAVVASPTIVAAETLVWGQAELQAGMANIGGVEGNAGSIDERDPTTYGLSGRVGVDWGALGAQLDLSHNRRDIEASTYTGYLWGDFAALRVNYDFSDALTVGAVYSTGAVKPADDGKASFRFYGLEGAYMAGSGAYGLQFGKFNSRDSDLTDAFHDGSYARVVAIYAMANGGVIEGELGYFDGKQDSADYDMRAVTWAVEYSRQFASKPMAWSVGVDGGHFTNGDSFDNGTFRETRLTAGLTVWFGDEDFATVKKRGVFSQPDMARIIEAGNSVD